MSGRHGPVASGRTRAGRISWEPLTIPRERRTSSAIHWTRETDQRSPEGIGKDRKRSLRDPRRVVIRAMCGAPETEAGSLPASVIQKTRIRERGLIKILLATLVIASGFATRATGLPAFRALRRRGRGALAGTGAASARRALRRARALAGGQQRKGSGSSKDHQGVGYFLHGSYCLDYSGAIPARSPSHFRRHGEKKIDQAV